MYKRQELTKAFKECRKLLSLNPEDKEGNLYLGEIYSALNLHHQAEEAFEKAIQWSSEHPRSLIGMSKTPGLDERIEWVEWEKSKEQWEIQNVRLGEWTVMP